MLKKRIKNRSVSTNRIVMVTEHPELGYGAIRRKAFARRVSLGLLKPYDECGARDKVSEVANTAVKRLFRNSPVFCRRVGVFHQQIDDVQLKVTIFQLEIRQRHLFAQIENGLYLPLHEHSMHDQIRSKLFVKRDSLLPHHHR